MNYYSTPTSSAASASSSMSRARPRRSRHALMLSPTTRFSFMQLLNLPQFRRHLEFRSPTYHQRRKVKKNGQPFTAIHSGIQAEDSGAVSCYAQHVAHRPPAAPRGRRDRLGGLAEAVQPQDFSVPDYQIPPSRKGNGTVVHAVPPLISGREISLTQLGNLR